MSAFFIWSGAAMEAGYTQQSAADHLLSCPFAVFCRYGGNIYLTMPEAKSTLIQSMTVMGYPWGRW